MTKARKAKSADGGAESAPLVFGTQSRKPDAVRRRGDAETTPVFFNGGKSRTEIVDAGEDGVIAEAFVPKQVLEVFKEHFEAGKKKQLEAHKSLLEKGVPNPAKRIVVGQRWPFRVGSVKYQRLTKRDYAQNPDAQGNHPVTQVQYSISIEVKMIYVDEDGDVVYGPKLFLDDVHQKKNGVIDKKDVQKPLWIALEKEAVVLAYGS